MRLPLSNGPVSPAGAVAATSDIGLNIGHTILNIQTNYLPASHFIGPAEVDMAAVHPHQV